MTLRKVLQLVVDFRKTDDMTPVVLMGYANPIEAMGLEKFAAAAAQAGVDGVLVVDYPPEEALAFGAAMKAQGMDPIFLLAPTSNAERIAQVAEIAALVEAGTVNDKLARQVIEGVLAGEGTPAEVVAARGLAVVSDDGALSAAVERAIAANPDVAERIREGKLAAAGALIGAVMKDMRGQADAGRVRELILAKLG